jgi:hypothetical protein
MEVVIEGLNSPGSPFSAANGCPHDLAPGASCKITVTFAPTATGKQSSALMIEDNAKTAPQSVTVTGKGK